MNSIDAGSLLLVARPSGRGGESPIFCLNWKDEPAYWLYGKEAHSGTVCTGFTEFPLSELLTVSSEHLRVAVFQVLIK